MNGLHIIDEKDPSFADKLLRREPRENASIEINNVLASATIRQVARYDVEKILSEHDIDVLEAKRELMNIYEKVLTFYVNDFALSEEELENLAHLQEIFSLTPQETGQIHTNIISPIYQNAVRNAIFDNKLTTEEEVWLKKIAENLHIPQEHVDYLYGSVVQPWLQVKLTSVLADGKLSPEEEKELSLLTTDLKATLSMTPQFFERVNRARFLWRLGNGEFPHLQVPIFLKNNEFCAAFVNTSLYEMRRVNKGMRFSGEVHDYKYYDKMSMTGTNIIEDEFQRLDVGVLYYTNQRLLFNGSRGNFDIPLRSIVGAAFYRDGMSVERSNGPDQTFIFNADIEALKVVFETLINRARL